MPKKKVKPRTTTTAQDIVKALPKIKRRLIRGGRKLKRILRGK